MRLAKGGYAKELSNCISCHHDSVIIIVLLCVPEQLVFVLPEMVLRRHQLRFSQHKEHRHHHYQTQPDRPEHPDVSIRCTMLLPLLNQNTVVSQIIRRTIKNATSQVWYQNRRQTQFRLVAIF